MSTETVGTFTPRTMTEALLRIRHAVTAAAIERNIRLPGRLVMQSELTEHWMFVACREEAEKYGWPMKAGAPTSWTSGDTIAKYLQRFDFAS